MHTLHTDSCPHVFLIKHILVLWQRYPTLANPIVGQDTIFFVAMKRRLVAFLKSQMTSFVRSNPRDALGMSKKQLLAISKNEPLSKQSRIPNDKERKLPPGQNISTSWRSLLASPGFQEIAHVKNNDRDIVRLPQQKLERTIYCDCRSSDGWCNTNGLPESHCT